MTTCENHKHTVVCFQAPQFECPLCRAEADYSEQEKVIEILTEELHKTKADLIDLQTRLIENA